jgi:hypothetical protein
MDFDVKITPRTSPVQLAQTRARRYQASEKGKADHAARSRKTRADTAPEFIGVDSEGIGRGKNHRAVLLGVGKEYMLASDMRRGLQWKETFQFLYDQFAEHPRASFVGFYLSYDFNSWLRSLPSKAAWQLLTKEGIRNRRMTSGVTRRRQYNAVKVDGWEVDMLGFKRLSIRPRPDGCNCFESRTKCFHKHLPWMHICDAGPFFQMPFIKVIDPVRWEHDPGKAVCSDEQYDRIKKGKEKRAVAMRVTKEMIAYNAEENALLSVVMGRLAAGFKEIGIRPAKDQWYGPGATASRWLSKEHAIKRRELEDIMPAWFIEACHNSYYGGWFEIFSHGLIQGTSHNYDINNAYPFAATKLPHICRDCHYQRGKDSYKGNGIYVLLYCTVFTKGDRIGAVPYRDSQGAILRPSVSKGWYWKFELDAAQRAGLVKKVMEHEWVEFIPCDHEAPFSEIRALYNKRLEVGKNGAQGMAIKLNNNSVYGKFAQSIGNAPYNNWLYASYITSHCRTQILDAIATHPGGTNSVLMVATDGICFDSVHPNLSVSLKLGEWDYTPYTDLCLFKPGVYWHHKGKESLLEVKSRGVPKAAFAEQINMVEQQYRLICERKRFPDIYLEQEFEYFRESGEFPNAEIGNIRSQEGWPHIVVTVEFSMRSCKQALNEGKWINAGLVENARPVFQSSDPTSKRKGARYNVDADRIDSYIHDLPIKELQSKYHGEVKMPAHTDLGYNIDGNVSGQVVELLSALRDAPAQYDIDLDDKIQWVTVWDEGPV